MELIELLVYIGGVGVSVIGYFLKRSMDEIKEVKEIAYMAKNKTDLIEVDYINKVERLNEKFDDLSKAIERLTSKLENLIKSI